MSLGRTVDCEICIEPFPEELVHPMLVKTRCCMVLKTFEVCPICALELKRFFHDDPEYMFEGEMALEFYRKALEYNERRSCNVNTET